MKEILNQISERVCKHFVLIYADSCLEPKEFDFCFHSKMKSLANLAYQTVMEYRDVIHTEGWNFLVKLYLKPRFNIFHNDSERFIAIAKALNVINKCNYECSTEVLSLMVELAKSIKWDKCHLNYYDDEEQVDYAYMLITKLSNMLEAKQNNSAEAIKINCNITNSTLSTIARIYFDLRSEFWLRLDK